MAYRVMCRDDEGLYCWATRRIFNLNGALHYAKSIALSRDPMVVEEPELPK